MVAAPIGPSRTVLTGSVRFPPMGVLDDAIKEHLDLKRKHGAPEDEVNRQQEEALGPVRRDAAQEDGDAEGADGAAEAVDAVEADGDGEAAATAPDDVSPATAPEPAEPGEPEAPAGPGSALFDAEATPGVAPSADVEPAPEPEAGAAEPVSAPPPEPDFEFEAPPARAPDPAAPAEPAPEGPTESGSPPARSGDTPAQGFDPPPAQDAAAEPMVAEPSRGHDSGETQEYDPFADDIEDVPDDSEAAEGDPAEGDVLEDTPDFLQETPEHDRLWFEQKPPRDFDFD